MTKAISAALAAAGSWLADLLLSLIAQWQARADQQSLGAAEAERRTRDVLDSMEADQDAIDRMGRDGARGVLARLRERAGGAGADRR